MEPVLIAAIRLIDAKNPPRKTEIDLMQNLRVAVENYKAAHQGLSESSENLRISSSSILRASAL